MARRKLNIYFDAGLKKPSVFQVTEARYRSAARRHPALARHVRARIGDGERDLAPMIGEVDALVGFHFPTGLIRDQATNLKWLHATGAGVDHLLPLDWLPGGAILTNNRGVHAAKTLEAATLAILALNTRLPEIVTNQRAARWTQVFTPAVRGRTLLVVGVGGMGGAAARAGKRLGMQVLGVRRSGRGHHAVDEMFAPADLARVIPRADVVFVTAPLTPDTMHLVGRAELDRMKPSAGLVNFGRAGVVDYRTLAAKLRRKEIAGAILDVFDPEPLPSNSPLWRTPDLIITPHVTSDDDESYMPLTLDLVFENVARLLDGRPLKNAVRPEHGY
jgi:phosphoglycerate dehydrogenase-like enzyme